MQGLPAAFVLVVHARDQLGHHPEPAVEVDGGDVHGVGHESTRYLGDVPVPEPDTQKVQHVLRGCGGRVQRNGVSVRPLAHELYFGAARAAARPLPRWLLGLISENRDK